MTVILMSFVLMLVLVAAMAIGVLLGRQPIKGSCGGVGAALGEKDYTCEICGDDPNKCEREQGDAKGGSALFYNADKNANKKADK